MPSLGSILSVAATALRTQQQALEVTSHNIANVNTEGYTRQRADLQTLAPLQTPQGSFGTGVRIVDVEHRRDALADASYRFESGQAERFATRRDLVGRLEALMGEPGDRGISGTLDAFFSAWSELASNPSATVPRTAVLDAGRAVAGELNRQADALQGLRTDALERITDSVGRINELSAEVARLNQEIVAAETGGLTAPDLRDARGRALDELAGLVDIEVIPQDGGAVRVVTQGYGLADPGRAGALEVVDVGGTLEIRAVGSPTALPVAGGRLAGALDVYNVDLADAGARLDDLAAALVQEVNALHQTGTTPSGATGVDFFDPTRTTAATVAVAGTVEGDPSMVAAGTGTADAVPLHRPGANDVALGLAGLRDVSIGALGDTFGGHVVSLAASVGTTIRSAGQAAEVHRVMSEQALNRRESTAGVSVDEELVALIRFQTAYGAAARVITTADEMLQSLLRI